MTVHMLAADRRQVPLKGSEAAGLLRVVSAIAAPADRRHWRFLLELSHSSRGLYDYGINKDVKLYR